MTPNTAPEPTRIRASVCSTGVGFIWSPFVPGGSAFVR